MSRVSNWLVIFVIAAACTCGARTECGTRAQISLLTSIHDDGLCRRVSSKGVLLYEASQLMVEQYNAKTNGFNIELAVLDTCGSISGSLKAAMKALVSADVGCLQPPHYLGIIGPDNPTNAEAVQKVTSVLRVPHLVRKPSNSPFLHHLAMESDSYIVQGLLKVVESLKWKTFTLVAPSDDDNNDDVQNIARKLTIEAIAKKLCVIIYDSEEGEYAKNVIHIGKPEDGFFTGPLNSTILVASEGKLSNQISRINSSNTIILLEDERNDLIELQSRVEKSKFWTVDQSGKFDPEELREVRWVQDAIESYGMALDSICKKKKCKSQVNASDWNEMISKVLSLKNVKTIDESRGLNIMAKKKGGELETLGRILVKNNQAKITWKFSNDDVKINDNNNNNKNKKFSNKIAKKMVNEKYKKKEKNEEDEDEETDEGEEEEEEEDEKNYEDEENLPKFVKNIVDKSKNQDIVNSAACVSDLHEAKLTKDEDDHATHIVVTEMDDSEWWTMVGTVSGVGVAMFVIGILAVYIVYTNIRGPRSPKGQTTSSRRYSIDNDSSLRRVGSDREMPASGGGSTNNSRNQRQSRQQRSAHRRDSIRSSISDRSV